MSDLTSGSSNRRPINRLASKTVFRGFCEAKDMRYDSGKLCKRPTHHGRLVLGGITDQPLTVGEGDVRRRGPVSLVVGDDLNSVVLPQTDT
jgi:hypothetical protein